MDLILNGDTREMDTSDCANLAELVEAAGREGGSGEASVVVAVEVDGEALSPDELSVLESRTLDGVQRVSIESRPARAIALSVLAQGAEYTVRIAEAIGETVQHFQSGRKERGNEFLADVTDSLTVLTGITLSVSPELGSETASLVALQSEILPWLEELVEAQSEEDPIRIGDLLEYEISPRIEDWGSVMRKVVESSGAGSASDAPGTQTLSN